MNMHRSTTLRTGVFAAVIVTASIASTPIATAQGQPGQQPVRAIARIRGDVYRVQDNRHHTVFMVTSEGVILGDHFLPIIRLTSSKSLSRSVFCASSVGHSSVLADGLSTTEANKMARAVGSGSRAHQWWMPFGCGPIPGILS